MDVELCSCSSKITFLPALGAHTCSLLTRQKADIGRAQEQPEKSCSTAANEVFSIGMAVIVIIVRNCDNCEIMRKSSKFPTKITTP